MNRDVSHNEIEEMQWEIEYSRCDGQLVGVGPSPFEEAMAERIQMRELGVICSLPRPFSSNRYVCYGES